jgi:[ribosomal protein S18]-alanine N-acetyltransferase
VLDDAQNRGIGRGLVRALAGLAVARGCYGMFVLTDKDNEAAQHTYAHAGGTHSASPLVMFEWTFRERGVTPA